MLAAAVIAAPVTVSLTGAPLSSSSFSSSSGVRLARTDALALNDEQALVTDVWRVVNKQFVDGTFNGMGEEGWKKQKLQAVKSLADKEGNTQEGYRVIRQMLSSLDDPYTRFLDPDQYDALASVARGGSAGVGVQLQLEPDKGRVIILNTVKGGPAAGGGVLPGDELLEVDGESMVGATAELAAARLRGAPGSTVDMKVKHLAAKAGSGGGGAAGGAEERLSFTRAAVKVSPVETQRVSLGGGAGGSGGGIEGQGGAAGGATKTAGLVRISSFSQETASQLVEATRSLLSPAAGVAGVAGAAGSGSATDSAAIDALVVDLRGNAGGYMPAGVEAARLFLPPNAKIISEVRRDGTAETFLSEGIGSEVSEFINWSYQMELSSPSFTETVKKKSTFSLSSYQLSFFFFKERDE